MTSFLPGQRLSALLYHQAVAPILARVAPALPHAAALVGTGSDVLGFDTERSTDHHWGPRLTLFLAEADLPGAGPRIDAALRQHLPHTIHGFPTNFGPPDAIGVRLATRSTHGPVAHLIEITSVTAFAQDRLGLAADGAAEPLDWLLCPEQSLLEVTAGVVFHDDLGELTRLRQILAYYPPDLWRYLMAAQWQRIAQQEAFVGRCGEAGDDLGSRLIAAALVRDLMRLCFLFDRRYAPYAKWLGSAFAALPSAPHLQPTLTATLAAADWRERERWLVAAASAAARRHNTLAITPPLDPAPRPFHGRPFQVIAAERFARAIQATIADPLIQRLPADLGGIDQWVDSTEVLTRTARRRRLAAIYTAAAPPPAAPDSRP